MVQPWCVPSMPKGKISWRDTFMTWPSLSIRIQLLPWHWRVRWYGERYEPSITVMFGPLELDFMANRHPFELDREPVDDV